MTGPPRRDGAAASTVPATLIAGFRHPLTGSWPPLVWASLLVATSPLVLPGLALLGYLLRTGRAAASDEPAPRPGALLGPIREGLEAVAAAVILSFLVLLVTAMVYLVVFLPTWSLDHPVLFAVDVAATLGGIYAVSGSFAVLAATADLGAAVGTPLAALALSRYFLLTVAIAVAVVLLVLELALRGGGPLAAGATTPYLLLALFGTLGRGWRGAESRGLVEPAASEDR